MPRPFVISVRDRKLFRWQEHFRRHHEFDLRDFGVQSDALELPFFAAVSFKREQVLILEVIRDLVEIRLERNRESGAEIIRFRSSFFREPAQVRLRVESAERTAADVTLVGESRPSRC